VDSKEKIVTIIAVFILTAFFAAVGWINTRAKSDKFVEGKTPTRVKVEGITHSLMSALLSVVLFAGINQYSPTWELLWSGSLAVAGGAFLGESIIKFAERRLNNDRLL